MKQEFDGVILSGGTSSRMKLATSVPKQLLPIYNNKSLLQYQIEWLQRHGIAEVILAIDAGTHEYIVDNVPYLLKMADVSVEMEKLGTGGALRKAVDEVRSSRVYVLNVDDFLISDFYSPDELVGSLDGFDACVLTSRGAFPYGVIKSRGRRVISFDQKPVMDLKVSAGHYAFNVEMIRSEFPPVGDFETSVLPKMAQNKRLTFMDLDGSWITANNWKELKAARKAIEAFEHRRVYGVSSSSRSVYRGYGRV